MRLNTNIHAAVVLNSPEAEAEAEAQDSPRTKVANNFQDLQLEDRCAVSKLDLQRSNVPVLKPREEAAPEENAVRKRMKVCGGEGGGWVSCR